MSRQPLGQLVVSTAFSSLLLAAAACAGGSDSGAGASSSGTELELDASKFMKGTHSIRGTITLPAPVAGGVQLNVVGEGLQGNYVGNAGRTGASATAAYAILGLPPGKYKVQARVDTNGDGQVGDPGDYDGWARGSVEAPTTAQADADLVTVESSVTDVDFGLGVVP